MKFNVRKWLILMLILVVFACGCGLYKQNKSSYSADNKIKSTNEVVLLNSFGVSEVEDIMINGTLLNDGSKPKVDTLSSDLSTTNKKELEYGTKLVYSYNIHIDSLDLISSIADTEDLITTYSGYIENSSSENTNKNKFYNAEIRIPAEGAEDFLNALENIGNITSKSSSVSDKTLTYIDLEFTKNSYKEELSILSDLSKKADNVADLLEIEREMASIRAEIDSLETKTRTNIDNIIGSMSGDSAVTLIGISEEAGIVYETNNSGTVNYVNGNPVDISYSYVQQLSNSAGSQSYNISIDANAGAYALLADVYEPAAVYYHNSTRPAMQVSSRPALMLTFYSDSDFYRIHCVCSGAYAMNNLWQDLNFVTVLIDPDTGKLIDIVEYNYYYDFAPVGSNSITFTRPYSMTFYNN